MKNHIRRNIDHLELLLNDEQLLSEIERSILVISKALSKNLPLLVFGNGGSASDALHITAELVGKFNETRKGFNVICLNSNMSVITAWSNDMNFESVYSRQIDAHGISEAVCMAISTSGNSKSVVNGVKHGKKLGMTTIGLTGESGGDLKGQVDILINAPSNITPRIQELHLPIYHYICEMVEYNLKDLKS